MKKGFTLIELLIVVAIIAILAAIAVPNFLEAQTRSKVSRCKNDMRALSVGCEAYLVDNNTYPFNSCLPSTAGYNPYDQWTEFLCGLTTPVGYMSTVSHKDPFAPTKFNTSVNKPEKWIGSFFWIDYGGKNKMRSWGGAMAEYNPQLALPQPNAYLIYTWGPDRAMSNIEWLIWGQDAEGKWMVKPNLGSASIYDATNGTVSAGDIGRFGGEVPVSTP